MAGLRHAGRNAWSEGTAKLALGSRLADARPPRSSALKGAVVARAESLRSCGCYSRRARIRHEEAEDDARHVSAWSAGLHGGRMNMVCAF
eukprot:6185838-Pleurochrysis_carterae.AAC.6